MPIKDKDEYTFIVPVYGRSTLLGEALDSIRNSQDNNWRLLIADDGSDKETKDFIKRWIDKENDPRITCIRRKKNIGLFANLNQAVKEADTEWIVLLCSDDLILPNAIGQVSAIKKFCPDARLILSTFNSINEDGSQRYADSAWHHDQVSKTTRYIEPREIVPALLRLGSLNGNLTGMAFHRSLYDSCGGFRENWRHAADWEWVLRVSELEGIVLNRTPIAQVRTHRRQLSNLNRMSGHELREVAHVVKLLKDHRLLSGEAQRRQWAAQIMKHQLWNLIKSGFSSPISDTLNGLRIIEDTAGLGRTTLTLIKWVPSRWKQRRHRK